MKSKTLVAVLVSFLMFGAMSSRAFAWTYGLTGVGACQPDGSFKITWTIDNTTESEALNIKSSSNPAVVPVQDALVPANDTKDFTQKADGTQSATFTLDLEANWPSDPGLQSRSASVELKTPCAQPPPGAGSEVPAPQVKAPVGPVNAGIGDDGVTSLGVALGLIGSVTILGFGLRQLHKQRIQSR